MEIKNEQEIVALGKLLNFVKYNCNDNECLLFAASPIINEIYAKVLNELNSLYTKKGRDVIEGYDHIEKYPIYLESIKENIKRTENWKELSNEIKEKYIHELISPYEYMDETKISLLNYGNTHFN